MPVDRRRLHATRHGRGKGGQQPWRGVERRGKARPSGAVADSAVQSMPFLAICRTAFGLLLRMPWARMMTHLAILLFWIVVLTGVIKAVQAIDRPVAHIDVSGQFGKLVPGEVEQVLAPYVEESFFTIDLHDVKRALQAHPWVAEAIVERRWPDTLSVQVREQVPIATWNSNGFYLASGETIFPGIRQNLGTAAAGGQESQLPSELPHLSGPQGAAGEVYEKYQQWQRAFSPFGLEIERLVKEKRGAWQVDFAEGWSLVLGSQDIEARLQRFMVLFEKRLVTRREQIANIDARYNRGVAVSWKETAEPSGS